MSRRTVVIVMAFLLALGAGSFAQETKPPDTTKQTTKKKAKAKKAASNTQGTAKDTSKDQAAAKGATKETTKDATKDQGAAKKVPKDVVILKGAPMGGVKFMHAAHSKDRKIKCETCHHPSKTEKPATAAQQACRDCHSSVAKPPMKTKLQAAFHDPKAASGTCIDCHKAENAKGKKAPTKCMECHKKENA